MNNILPTLLSYYGSCGALFAAVTGTLSMEGKSLLVMLLYQ